MGSFLKNLPFLSGDIADADELVTAEDKILLNKQLFRRRADDIKRYAGGLPIEADLTQKVMLGRLELEYDTLRGEYKQRSSAHFRPEEDPWWVAELTSYAWFPMTQPGTPDDFYPMLYNPSYMPISWTTQKNVVMAIDENFFRVVPPPMFTVNPSPARIAALNFYPLFWAESNTATYILSAKFRFRFRNLSTGQVYYEWIWERQNYTYPVPVTSSPIWVAATGFMPTWIATPVPGTGINPLANASVEIETAQWGTSSESPVGLLFLPGGFSPYVLAKHWWI